MLKKKKNHWLPVHQLCTGTVTDPPLHKTHVDTRFLSSLCLMMFIWICDVNPLLLLTELRTTYPVARIHGWTFQRLEHNFLN